MSFQPVNPRPFLQARVGTEMIIRLKWGQTEYKGSLESIDSYMNVLLRDTEEFIDGKNTGSLGLVLISIFHKMRNMPSKFIELFDSSPSSPKRISTHDVRLEDVLAHQEASLTSLQSRSSTFSSSKLSLSLLDKDRERELSFSPSPTTTSTTTQRSHTQTHTPSSSRWKRLSSMLGSRRAS